MSTYCHTALRGVTQGATLAIEVTREPIPGAESWKRPLARLTDKALAFVSPSRTNRRPASSRVPTDRLQEPAGTILSMRREAADRSSQAASCGCLHAGDDPDRRRRLSCARGAGACSARRQQPTRSGGSILADRSGSTCRPSGARRLVRTQRSRSTPCLPQAVRTDRCQRLRLRPDRPAAYPRLAGRACAGPTPRSKLARCFAGRFGKGQARSGSSRTRRSLPFSTATTSGSTLSRGRSAARSSLRADASSPHVRRVCRQASDKTKKCPLCGKPEAPGPCAVLQPRLQGSRPAEMARRRLSHRRARQPTPKGWTATEATVRERARLSGRPARSESPGSSVGRARD